MNHIPKDELFQTLVVGSLPRPQWIRDLVEDRKKGRIGDVDANRLLDDSIPMAIRMQERAGLDFISDGEWRRESYVKVFSDSVDGFEQDIIKGGASSFSQLSYPGIVSRLSYRKPIAVDEARFLLEHTDSKTIVAVPSPYTIGRRMWSPEHSTDAYATAEEFMEACVPIVRNELRQLADIGVDAIQLDDPWLALNVDPDYRKREGITDIEREVELSVRCVNGATEGIDNVSISVHLCHAHYNREHSTKGPYNLIIDGLGKMNVNRLALEMATPDAGSLDCLRMFPDNKVLGLGIIDHTNPHIETPTEVMESTEKAMEFVPKERITLNPDCGFAPSSMNPMDIDEAYLKLKAMCDGASLLRDKYN